jgi:hypothetical protein
MSTNPVAPKATASSVLNSLSQVGGEIGLAIQIGTALIPVGKALVSKIKDAATGVTTITYQLLVTEDQATLAAIDGSSTADLEALNAELVRQGAKPLPIPGPAGPQVGSGG